MSTVEHADQNQHAPAMLMYLARDRCFARSTNTVGSSRRPGPVQPGPRRYQCVYSFPTVLARPRLTPFEERDAEPVVLQLP